MTVAGIQLSPREAQCIALLIQGISNKEIAARMGLTPGTVKVYFARLFKETGKSSRFDLALWAIKTGAFENVAIEAKKPRNPKYRDGSVVASARQALAWAKGEDVPGVKVNHALDILRSAVDREVQREGNDGRTDEAAK